MVLENITSNFIDLAKSIPAFNSLIKIAQIAVVVVIFYIIFLIIRSVVAIKSSLRIKKLVKDVEKMDKKIDILIGKRKK